MEEFDTLRGRVLLPLVIVFIIGFISGSDLRKSPEVKPLIQKDTVITYDTMRYSRFQMDLGTYEIDWARYKNMVPEYVYVDRESTKDTSVNGIPYIMMQRQYLMTEMNGAKIMHSGIGSRIDSVEIFIPVRTISATVPKKEARNSLALGIGVAISSYSGIPISIAYDYRICRWLYLGGQVEYDLINHRTAVEIGAKIPLEW